MNSRHWIMLALVFVMLFSVALANLSLWFTVPSLLAGAVFGNRLAVWVK